VCFWERDKLNSTFLTFFIALLVGCSAGIAGEIYISSFAAMADGLETSLNNIQWTLSTYLLGLSISQLIYGPLSDGIGRRPALLAGMFMLFVGSLVCTMAPTIQVVLLGRFIQGAGAGAGAALWRTIFRDSFDGDQLSRYFGYVAVLVPFIMPSAPALGAYLQTYSGWRSIFSILSIYGAIAFLAVYFLYKETSIHHHPDRLRKEFIAHSFKRLLSSRAFMGYAICAFLSSGASYAWLTASPVLLIKVVGLTPIEFGWITLLTGGSAMILAGLINGYLVGKLGTHAVLRMAFTFVFVAGCLLMILKFTYGINAPVLLVPSILLYFGSSLAWGNISASAFHPFGKIAGYAGSLFSFIMQAGGFVSSSLIAYLPDTNQVPLAAVVMGCAALSWFMLEFVVRPEKA